jgi:uncharacterized protein (TIGR03067 family)
LGKTLAKNLPARPSRDHLRRQAKTLRELEGEWRFVGMQIDGADMPAAALAQSRLLFDGDRFRMESPEASYDGVFTIEVDEEPMRIDIDFVEGPEAGNQSYGIFEQHGDQLTICLGVVGATRPRAFSTKPGSGHALERLRRASVARPAGVTGGTRREKASAPKASKASAARRGMVGSAAQSRRRRDAGELACVRIADDERKRDESRVRRTGDGAREDAARRARDADCRGLSESQRRPEESHQSGDRRMDRRRGAVLDGRARPAASSELFRAVRHRPHAQPVEEAGNAMNDIRSGLASE